MEQGGSQNEKLELFKSQVQFLIIVLNETSIECWVQAKQLLKKLNPRSTSKMSIESHPFVFQ